jgi:hypothetical protein
MFVLLASAALAAVQAAPATAQAPAAAAEVKEEKICRKVETSSSRMTKRTCKTASEWAKDDKSGANAADLKRLGGR